MPLVEQLTKALRALTRKLLIIKLTPNVTNVGPFAAAAEAAGADAISLINTVIGMSVDIHTCMPRISTVTGGLSGPAIKPIALAKVYEARKACSIPIIGIGGITSASDVMEFLIVGASLVQIGTANFINPNIGNEICSSFVHADGTGDFKCAGCRCNIGSFRADESFGLVSVFNKPLRFLFFE